MSEEKEKKGCERCKVNPPNVYKKGLPRSVSLCDPCWTKFNWARVDRQSVWEADNGAFLEGFLRGDIPPYPESDPLFRLRLAMRSVYRLREKRVLQRVALTRSFSSRSDDLHLAAEILDEPFKKLRDKVLVEEVSPGISAMEGRLEKSLKLDPVYTRYLKNVNDAHCGPGVITLAGILGEIGSARAVLCFRHERNGKTAPRLFHNCEHGRGAKPSEAMLVSQPNQRVKGIWSFPTGGDLRSFFGLGFSKTGGSFPAPPGVDSSWYVRSKMESGGELAISLARKKLVVEFLAGSIEKAKNPDNPWNKFLQEEKVRKKEEWKTRFAENPPPVCTACRVSGCEKCGNFTGNWERPGDPEQVIWVCRCHEKGYWFGSDNHLRNHARGKIASVFLDFLFHTWRYIEGSGEAPYHPLATQFLTK